MARPRFRPMRPIGYALLALLVSHVFVHLRWVDGTLEHVALVDRALAGDRVRFAEFEAVEAQMFSAGGWAFLLLIVTAIVWPMWQYQGHANVIRRRVEGVRFTPGWGIGWWFVPIANLWKPYRAMSELARASEEPDRWRELRPPWALIPWWLTWLAGTTITRVLSIRGPATSLEAARQIDVLQLVASGCTIAAALTGAAIVASITADQERMAVEAPPIFEVMSHGAGR